MRLYLKNHNHQYAASQMLTVLLPEHKLFLSESPPDKAEDGALSSLFLGPKLYSATCRLSIDGKAVTATAKAPAPSEAPGQKDERIRLEQRLVRQSIYRAYCRLTGDIPPWGSLSGVRPTKLVTRHLAQGGTPATADRMLKNTYNVTDKRRRLCVEAGQHTMAAIQSLKADELSLYIGIPFCPTRCSYCSFVSHSIEHSAALIEPFLKALDKELDTVSELVSQSGMYVRTIYIGGGTPTTLTAPQLEWLIGKTARVFYLSRLTEYTVEAGRPDTIDQEKLSVMKALGVTRISVNPQTMRDQVLRAIGRGHTVAQTEQALRLAKATGFEAVNADLIAGLPGDELSDFCRSLDRVIDFDPENITVHTLSLKRGADLMESRGQIPSAAQVGAMLDYAGGRLRDAGYSPYYLYRQKYMAGSFENVGWTKPGHDNLYNICMMEELHTILSCGGAASTKVITPGGRLVRQTNPKYPKEYIQSIDKTVADKQHLSLKG